jgi:hypothetical protein
MRHCCVRSPTTRSASEAAGLDTRLVGRDAELAAEPLDLGDDPCDRVAHHQAQLLGIESLTQRGRAHKVSKERRHNLALVAQLRAHGAILTRRRPLARPGVGGAEYGPWHTG